MSAWSRLETAVAVTAGAALAALTLFFWNPRRRPNEPWIKVGYLQEIWIHPVKSFKAKALTQAFVGKIGLEDDDTTDRQLMVVTSLDEMVTLRTHPRLVLITADIVDGELLLDADGAEPFRLHIASATADAAVVTTKMWGNSSIEGLDCGRAVGDWISKFLGSPPGSFKLIFHDIELQNSRSADRYHKATPKMLRRREKTLFSDATTYHLMSAESVSGLNAELPPDAAPVTLANFRPNFTVGGTAAFAEDGWAQVRVGEEGGPTFTVVKQTDRCFLTTTDMRNGEHRADGEPVKTLRRIRPGTPAQQKLNRHAPLLGLSLYADSEGIVRVHDPIYVRFGDPEQ